MATAELRPVKREPKPEGIETPRKKKPDILARINGSCPGCVQRRGIVKLLVMGALLPRGALLRAAVPPVSTGIPLPEPLLPLFPLPLVLFPRTSLTLHIFEERYKEMIQDCLRKHSEFGVLFAYQDSVENIGCTASISQVMRRYPDGQMDILVPRPAPI